MIVSVAFWSLAVLALMLLGVGIVTQRWWLSAAGCAIALPFLLYLFATSLFRYWALSVVALNCASAVAVARGYRWLALAALVPFAGIAVWLASAVLMH